LSIGDIGFVSILLDGTKVLVLIEHRLRLASRKNRGIVTLHVET
jgi:hypothetical protein